MSATEYDLLGPAEKHIAKQLHDGFENSLKPLHELVEKIELLASIDFEEVMLDPKKKDTAVSFVDVLSKMPQRVSDLTLGVLIAEVVFAKATVEP